MADHQAEYLRAIACRRAFQRDGFRTLAEAGFDGDYVSPIQMTSCALEGPILIAKHWFDYPSAVANKTILSRLGYMPGIKFNNVLDEAFSLAGLERSEVYMTQIFHLLPSTRSQSIKSRDARASFEQVTQFELMGRQPIALGGDAASVLRHFDIKHLSVIHPSARQGTDFERAQELAEILLKSQ